MFRRLVTEEFQLAADFLDSRTFILRWLVAAFRCGTFASDAAASSWQLLGFGRGADASEESSPFSGVLAHFWPTGTLYICGDPEMDLKMLENLCEEELCPERVVGDREILDRWSALSPWVFSEPARQSELDVLAYGGSGCVASGFRRAVKGDIDLIREYSRLLYVELDEDETARPGVEPLVDEGLLFVLEEEGRVKGMVYSNLFDGRYVQGGGVFVHPAYRHQGLGVALAKSFGDTIREEQGGTAILDVFRENRVAVKTYNSAGYEKVGEGRAVWLREDAWA